MTSMTVAILVVVLLVGLATGLVLWASGPSRRPVDTLAVCNKAPNGAGPAHEALTLVTWNIGYASGDANNRSLIPVDRTRHHLEQIRDTLLDARADLAVLQEVDFAARRSGYLDEAEAVAHGQFPCIAKASNWDKRWVPYPAPRPRRQFGELVSGQATLSRFPLPLAARHVFAKPASNSWLYNRFYIDRVALVTDVPLKDTTLVLVNVHLEAFRRETRERQAAELRELLMALVADERLPLIVAGDFNTATLEESTLDTLCAGGFLRRAADARLPTFPAWAPAEELDHFLVNDRVRVHGVEVLGRESTPSDHLPLALRFSCEPRSSARNSGSSLSGGKPTTS